jgi:hypothetical protein
MIGSGALEATQFVAGELDGPDHRVASVGSAGSNVQGGRQAGAVR